MIILNQHQFWIEGTKNIHANCGTKVYGDDQGNRFCTDKECIGSHPKFSIDPMTELVTIVDYETKYKYSKTVRLDLVELEKMGIVENVEQI